MGTHLTKTVVISYCHFQTSILHLTRILIRNSTHPKSSWNRYLHQDISCVFDIIVNGCWYTFENVKVKTDIVLFWWFPRSFLIRQFCNSSHTYQTVVEIVLTVQAQFIRCSILLTDTFVTQFTVRQTKFQVIQFFFTDTPSTRHWREHTPFVNKTRRTIITQVEFKHIAVVEHVVQTSIIRHPSQFMCFTVIQLSLWITYREFR